MSKKLFDLFEFDKFIIEKSKKYEGVVYYTGQIKNIKTWTYSNPDEKPLTRYQAIKKAKEQFIGDLWGEKIIELSDDENKPYFIQLQKDLHNRRDEVKKWLKKKGYKLEDEKVEVTNE